MSDVFVFGSNLAGRHGKGAALHAKKHYGAEYGIGEGRTGNAYGIPTKDKDLKVISLFLIELYVCEFIAYAKDNPEDTFLLTPFGTGLAGYKRTEIFELIRNCAPIPSNVVFTKEWFGL